MSEPFPDNLFGDPLFTGQLPRTFDPDALARDPNNPTDPNFSGFLTPPDAAGDLLPENGIPIGSAEDLANQQSIEQRLGGVAVGGVFSFGNSSEQSPATPEASPLPPASQPEVEPTVGEIAQAARKVLDAKLARTLLPIVESLRGEPAHRDKVEAMLFGGPKDDLGRSTRFLLSERTLSLQRPLRRWESRQLRTMAELSAANPYIMAAAEVPEVTNVCVDAYLTRLGNETRERLPDGAYIPIAVLGAGLHGIVTAGEILRKRPDLVDKAVFIDRAHLPGGPFEYPKGKAWNLNSAGPQGQEPFTLPDDNDVPSATEGIRGRGGGMLRHYPGERNATSTPQGPRLGSINRLIEYFPAPDTGSPSRYINNMRMALMAKEQAALTMGNFLNDSDLVAVEPNTSGGPGLLKLTLEDIKGDGTRELRTLYVDEFWTEAGKQRQNRAFELTASFNSIMLAQAFKPGLPYYTSGLEPYKLLTDRTQPEKLEHGSRFILVGDGNTVETQLEALAGLFQEAATEGNFDASKIEKIYIVGSRATEKIACRPRYKQIVDLLSRNGRENVLEIIDARAQYLDSITTPEGKRELFMQNRDGEFIRDSKGAIVYGDHVFDSTGFKTDLDDAFRPFLDELGVDTLEEAWEDITLPGNPDIAVGRRIIGRPNMAFFGTIVPPKFNDAKRAQLPDTSRQVLEAVSENVVAIGFTTPDTQAGVGIQLDSRTDFLPRIDLDAIDANVKGNLLSGNNTGFVGFSNVVMPESAPTSRFVESGSALLTPLLLGSIATHRLDLPGGQEYRLEVTYGESIGFLNIVARSANGVPQDVTKELYGAAQDPYFAAYARRAIAQRRGAKAVEVVVSYQNGRLRPSSSYVQPV